MKRRTLFAAAILASAFLIFLVQPMVGKRILPWFGGAPSVWTLCLAFYQTTLFLGYAYAHLLIRFASPTLQLGIHFAVIAAAFLVLPVLPNDTWQPGGGGNPSTQILAMLSSNVALPFLVLASTGPLVQAWFARAYPDRSPYPLYAVSNVGSFVALLAFPFVFEPQLSLSTTGTFWSVAFAVTGLAVLGCAAISRQAPRGAGMYDVGSTEGGAIGLDSAHGDPTMPLRASHVALWILLAGCAVILLMGVTNAVCLDVASVPFLWILPLATYLLTFILCFGSERVYHRVPYVLLTLVGVLITHGLGIFGDWEAVGTGSLVQAIYVQVPGYCALLFGACMIMHGELYRLRPPPRSLTAFYLCVSGGGALGGLFVGLLAPVLFDGYYEVQVGLGLAVFLFFAAGALGSWESDPSSSSVRLWAIAAPAGCAISLYALWPVGEYPGNLIYQERGFFGVLEVFEQPGRIRQLHLVSGSTLHGLQFQDAKYHSVPSVYFGRGTGVGMLMGQRPDGQASKIGIVGLGVGTLTAYGREGDSFRYYEIDPAVAHVARDTGYFSFLEKSRAKVDVVLGDGRLMIAREQEEQGSQAFDFLILDAFSSDAIPVHLLTVEAFRYYRAAMAADGVLVVHVSNRHFDLLPLVARAGTEVGLSSLFIRTKQAPSVQSQISDWIILSPRAARLEEFVDYVRTRVNEMGLHPTHAVFKVMTEAELADAPLWTDDYSDLLGVLRLK